jgi:multicomponent Na+:H+ antiporter subunit C
MLYALCFLLFVIGLYCTVVKKNLVKIVLGIVIMEYSVNLFLIMLGYCFGGVAPVVDRAMFDPQTGKIAAGFLSSSVDPLPQALVLTSIVVGLGSLALMISLCIRIYAKYGTFDVTQIRRLKG